MNNVFSWTNEIELSLCVEITASCSRKSCGPSSVTWKNSNSQSIFIIIVLLTSGIDKNQLFSKVSTLLFHTMFRFSYLQKTLSII
jgi:hypothetical protein